MRNESSILDHYVTALKKEIKKWAELLAGEEVKTLYFGGGTPSKLGFDRILDIVSCLDDHFDLSLVGEFSLECNPYPEQSTLALVSRLQKELHTFHRLRFSFGLQSFDDTVLTESGRQTSFRQIVQFLRDLQSSKSANSVYNLDFIAFGKLALNKQGEQILWDAPRLNFFSHLLDSHFADSYSLYTLELFAGSLWYHELQNTSSKEQFGPGLRKYGSDNDVYTEFSILKEKLIDHGYRRYELSNFSLPGKSSIHNRAYREMENYLGLGTSGSSFFHSSHPAFGAIKDVLQQDTGSQGLRWSNTKVLGQYLQGKTIDTDAITLLSQTDFLIEEFFLGLRTDRGVEMIQRYSSVLVDNYQDLVEQLTTQGFVLQYVDRIVLTDQGMDVFNDIVTNLIKDF